MYSRTGVGINVLLNKTTPEGHKPDSFQSHFFSESKGSFLQNYGGGCTLSGPHVIRALDGSIRVVPATRSLTRSSQSSLRCGGCLLQKLLDRCLEDIEKFVGRLQHAASAFSKLERRRVGRKKTGNIVGPGGDDLFVFLP